MFNAEKHGSWLSLIKCFPPIVQAMKHKFFFPVVKHLFMWYRGAS